MSRPCSAQGVFRTHRGVWSSEDVGYPPQRTQQRQIVIEESSTDDEEDEDEDLPHFCCPECGKYITHVFTVSPDAILQSGIHVEDSESRRAQPPPVAMPTTGRTPRAAMEVQAIRPAPRLVEVSKDAPAYF